MHVLRIPNVILFTSCVLLGAVQSFAQTSGTIEGFQEKKTASIGVLAYRGNETALSQWQPFANFLSENIDGWTFELVPVTLTTVKREIDTKKIQFLITNPGHYVTLAAQYDLSALATRERRVKNSGVRLSKFGTVIFVAKDSAIASLNDLKGKKIAAVSPDAFGGFQIAWSEMQKQGVDAFRDLASLRFLGFPQDQIIAAVAEKKVDAGIIRSGLLETLAEEGKVRLEDFRVLNAQASDGFPYEVSSAMFSEWPFASLASVDKRLREQVLITLLMSQDPAIASKYDLLDLWSAPLSYENTRKLIGDFRERLALTNNADTSTLFSLTTIAAFLALIGMSILSAFIYYRQKPLLPEPVPDAQMASLSSEFLEYLEKLKSLTSRERQILGLICMGHQTKSIADKLRISPKTVEFHRTNLLQKTDAGTTAHLVQIATRLGYDQEVSLGQ